MRRKRFMMAIVNSLMNATITITGILNYLKDMVAKALADTAVAGIFSTVKGLLNPVWAYRYILLMVLALVVALFGKRMFGLLKFFGGFEAGFVVGVVFLAPKLTFLPSYVIGAVIGLVVALLMKFLYYVLLVGGVGYGMYYIAFAAPVLPVVFNFTKGNLLFSAVAAVVAVVLVLVLRKWLEMLGTAAAGAYMLTYALTFVYDVRTIGFLANYGDIPLYVIMGLVTLVGFVIQVKTRKKY